MTDTTPEAVRARIVFLRSPGKDPATADLLEALAARLAEVEAQYAHVLGHANRQEDRAEAAEAERDTALGAVRGLRTAQGAAGVLLEQDDKLLMNAAGTGLEDVMRADDPTSDYFIVFRAILRALTQETPDGQ